MNARRKVGGNEINSLQPRPGATHARHSLVRRLPDWRENLVYQNAPGRPEGPGRIRRYPSQATRALNSIRKSLLQLLVSIAWAGDEESVSWPHRLKLLAMVTSLVFVAKMAVTAGRT